MGTKTQKLSNIVDQIVEWQSVVVADGSTNTTGVSGRGYFIDTSAGTHTINLPGSPKIGDVIRVSLITAGNDLTIGRNGNNIDGTTSDLTLSNDGDSSELVYVNASEGWKQVSNTLAANFIVATGGTVTESGSYKIHTFTGDGCFVVSQIGNGVSNPLGGPDTVDYLVVAGGGGGGAGQGGGGGAGGFRSFTDLPGTNSPLNAPAGLSVTTTTYPITVGGGGTGRLRTCAPATNFNGSDSVFSTITSAGGGGAGTYHPSGPARNGAPGGSGGGGGGAHLGGGTGGTGNTPPVSPPQGGNGAGTPSSSGGPHMGGGGGGAVTTATAAVGGDGSFVQTDFIGPTAPSYGVTGPSGRYFSGGGGGRPENSPVGEGGLGGGGDAQPTPATGPSNGATNTGGGGGGVDGTPEVPGGSGGKGIVIIRYKFQ